MQNMQKYKRLVADMHAAADLALRTDADREFVASLCGSKLREAAREFEALIAYLEAQEDDGR